MPCLCTKCLTGYDRELVQYHDWFKHNTCPRLDCGGEMVYIDELIYPTILLLNQNGYITEFCCSGHMKEDSVQCYILFTQETSDKIIKSFPVFPKHWEAKFSNFHRFYLGCDLKSKCDDEKYQQILKANSELYEIFYNFFENKD